MEDFMLRALLGGLGVAGVAGPLGCFVIWRRMIYFGAALAHSALLGVALGLALGLSPDLGIAVLCLLMALGFLALDRGQLVASDTLLGILAHASLALGLLALALLEGLRVDLMSYLFGDILALNLTDLVVIYSLMALVLGILLIFWRPLLSATVDEELARVEGLHTGWLKFLFTILMAVVIAIGMKVVGILMVISLLIIPAATARRLASSPENMALAAAACGALSVVAGLLGSYWWDLPSGAAIVAAAAALFLLSLGLPVRALRAIFNSSESPARH
ncbi:MAG: metal ABC transporter permease [Alphaproteobacteria bacterium]|nr:metal ABC transporter permease [Alphaproteobacteria bacterium]